MTILYSEQFVGGGCFSTKPVFAVDAKYQNTQSTLLTQLQDIS